jgi:hypothetical protein
VSALHAHTGTRARRARPACYDATRGPANNNEVHRWDKLSRTVLLTRSSVLARSQAPRAKYSPVKYATLASARPPAAAAATTTAAVVIAPKAIPTPRIQAADGHCSHVAHGALSDNGARFSAAGIEGASSPPDVALNPPCNTDHPLLCWLSL